MSGLLERHVDRVEFLVSLVVFCLFNVKLRLFLVLFDIASVSSFEVWVLQDVLDVYEFYFRFLRALEGNDRQLFVDNSPFQSWVVHKLVHLDVGLFAAEWQFDDGL